CPLVSSLVLSPYQLLLVRLTVACYNAPPNCIGNILKPANVQLRSTALPEDLFSSAFDDDRRRRGAGGLMRSKLPLFAVTIHRQRCQFIGESLVLCRRADPVSRQRGTTSACAVSRARNLCGTGRAKRRSFTPAASLVRDDRRRRTVCGRKRNPVVAR